MACTYQNRKEESNQRAQEGDVLRMLSQHFFCNLNHPVHTAGSLKRACAGNGCNDDIYNVRGRRAGLKAKAKNKYSQADAADGAKGQGSVTGTYIQRCQNNKQLNDHY